MIACSRISVLIWDPAQGLYLKYYRPYSRDDLFLLKADNRSDESFGQLRSDILMPTGSGKPYSRGLAWESPGNQYSVEDTNLQIVYPV